MIMMWLLLGVCFGVLVFLRAEGWLWFSFGVMFLTGRLSCIGLSLVGGEFKFILWCKVKELGIW